MKSKLLFFLFIIGFYSAKAQYTAIPDVNFETALINLGYDSGAIDHKVLTANINTITSLSIYNGPGRVTIVDLTGIQDFIALTVLRVKCDLTSLNVSGLKALTSLDCSYSSGLASLNLSGLTALKSLSCDRTSLTSLDVSGLKTLTSLSCSSTYSLTSLNVSGLTALASLNCSETNLTSLNLSGLTTLTSLNCGGCKLLTNLDVSGLRALQSFNCSNCYSLTSLNVSDLKALTSIDCSFCTSLKNLDVSGLTALKNLNCKNNQLTSLNLSGTTSLFYFQCVRNDSLACIQVDNVVAANAQTRWYKDRWASYSTNCGLATSNPQETLHIVNMFPNPTKNLLHINLENEISGKITDLTGKTLMKVNAKDIDVSPLKTGIYLLVITSEGKQYTQKIIKE